MTAAGRKLCYNLCGSSLKLTKVRVDVIVNLDDAEHKGFIVGFNQTISVVTGLTEQDLGVVYINGERCGVKLIPIQDIKPAKEFDVFSSHRATQVGETYHDYLVLLNSSEDDKIESELWFNQPWRTLWRVCTGERFVATHGDGYFCIAEHPITKELHELPIDENFSLMRFREMVHDTHNLIICKK
jgi:hypothetical protein